MPEGMAVVHFGHQIQQPNNPDTQAKMTAANLEQITQIGKPRRRNLTATAPRPRLEYKLVGHFNTDRVSDALKVEAYLNKDPYVAKPIGYNLVAIYRKIYNSS